MATPINTRGARVWDLPPLILHPFNERVAPASLLENSKAALMLAGVIPDEGGDQEELRRRVLAGRYSEVRMLFFVGKDVFRWIDQCCECVSRIPETEGLDLQPQSFAGLLSSSPPENVKEKLIRWGVADYSSIFSRAMGIQCLFQEPPDDRTLSGEFLKNYHRYADALFRCYMDLHPHGIAPARNFQFHLYASGEYSRLLESEWGKD